MGGWRGVDRSTCRSWWRGGGRGAIRIGGGRVWGRGGGGGRGWGWGGGGEAVGVLSGAAVGGLGFASGSGRMRVGNRANTTVGRFARLYMRNVPGVRTPPGDTDKASIGFTFNVAMVEDEAAVR